MEPEVSEMKSECPSVIVLAQSWNRHIKAIYGVERPLMRKEFGQLKTLRSKLGALTSEVMSWTMDNWHSFSLQTRDDAGLPCAPPTPHIGFLLKHHDIARRMRVQSIADEKARKKQKELQAQPKPEPKAPLSYEAAWMIYLKTETSEMRTKRQAAQNSYYIAGEAIKATPHDAAVQAEYLAAQKAFDEQGEAERKALKELGWDGETYQADISLKEKMAGTKVTA